MKVREAITKYNPKRICIFSSFGHIDATADDIAKKKITCNITCRGIYRKLSETEFEDFMNQEMKDLSAHDNTVYGLSA